MRFLLILFSILFCSCSSAQKKVDFEIKGIAFEAPKTDVTSNTFLPIKELGANYICLMPYAFTRNGEPDIKFNSYWQWKGEREEGIIQSIESAKQNGLKTMIKPHLWIHSQFTGDVTFKTEDEWKRWEKSYSDYVLFYALLAEKYNVEMFCIGTELKEFIKERPQFWNDLIQSARKVYNGEITYAANWDNYRNIPFWDRLDFIGIDAYFPLSEEKLPTTDVLKNSWKKWWIEIEEVSTEVKKPVIFTEIGYRSIDYCAKEPWVSYDEIGDKNEEAQYNALNTFFESVENKGYFKGAFLWKWHCDNHLPEKGNTKYTFQNKEAQKIIDINY